MVSEKQNGQDGQLKVKLSKWLAKSQITKMVS